MSGREGKPGPGAARGHAAGSQGPAGWRAVAYGLLVREQWLFRSSPGWMDVAYDRGLMAAWGPMEPGGLDAFLQRLHVRAQAPDSPPGRKTAFEACLPCIERLVEVNTGLRLELPTYFSLPHPRLQGILALTTPRRGAAGDPRSPVEAAIALEHEALAGTPPASVIAAAGGRFLFYAVQGVLTREERAVVGTPNGRAAVAAARQAITRALIDQALDRAGLAVPVLSQVSETIPDADVTLGFVVLAARPEPGLVAACTTARVRAGEVTIPPPAGTAAD